MRTTVATAAVLALLIGVGAGMLLRPTKTVVRTESVAASSKEIATLPVECRTALQLASSGLSAALDGFGQAQSAIDVPRSAGAASPALGVLGQSNARLQSYLQQYNQARAACSAAANVTSTNGGSK